MITFVNKCANEHGVVFLYIIGILSFFIFGAHTTHAEIFQFSETDPYYQTAVSIAAAQEAEDDVNIEQKIALDEDFNPEDFGLEEVGTLPTSPFYFFKNLRRGIQNVVTFDSTKKAELRLRFAAEKLLEAKTLAEDADVSEEEIIDAVKNFTEELSDVKARVEIASERSDEEELRRLADAFIDAMTKYNKSLGLLEKILPGEVFDTLTESKDRASETFSSVFLLGSSDDVSRALVRVLDEQKGSEFKHFKNIEILKEIEKNAPEDAKKLLRNVEQNISGKLGVTLTESDETTRTLFEDFLEEIGGNEARHLEIISELEVTPLPAETRDSLLSAKEEVLSKLNRRIASLPDEAKREKLLEHLKKGGIGDLRVVGEIESNIGDGVVSGVLSKVKEQATQNLTRRIQSSGENEGDRKDLEEEIERFHDVRSFTVFENIESLIPEDKLNIFRELKEKAVREIEDDVSRARNDAQREIILGALAGDHPEHFQALDKLSKEEVIGRSVLDGLKDVHYRQVENRARYINDEERLTRYENTFRDKEEFIEERFDAGVFEVIVREKRDIFGSIDKVDQKIKDAEQAIRELEQEMESIFYDSAFQGGVFDPLLSKIERLRALANRKIELVRVVIAYDDFGRGFSLAEEAERVARDAISLVKEYKSGKREVKKRNTIEHPFSLEGGEYVLYNEYEFSRFCVSMNGFLDTEAFSLVCKLIDGRVLDTSTGVFPIRIQPETLSCGGFAGVACPVGSFCDVSGDQNVADGLGKCSLGEDGDVCSTIYSGYVYNENENECIFERTQACENPYIYDSHRGCERAHGIGVVEDEEKEQPNGKAVCGNNLCEIGEATECPPCEGAICPLSPCTVGSCPNDCGQDDSSCQSANECSSKISCRTSGYYWCSFDNQCYSGASGCKQQEWITHTWEFQGGEIITSKILNRFDAEYSNHVNSIEKECRAIKKENFRWKEGAQNDDPSNWKNFGIPDCSGSSISQKQFCGDGVCNGDENGDWCPSDCGDVTSKECTDSDFAIEVKKRGTVTDKTGRYTDYCTDKYYLVEHVCSFNQVQKAANDPRGYDCRIFNKDFICEEGRCVLPEGVDPALSRCGDGICASSESRATCYADCGIVDTGSSYCGNQVCDQGETFKLCPRDCGDGTTDYCAKDPYFCGTPSDCDAKGHYWCSSSYDCVNSSSQCSYTGTTSCWGYGSDQSACSDAGCTWYPSHTDGPTGGPHCDNSGHATSGSGGPSSYTTSSSCGSAGYYWCSTDSQCYSSSAGCYSSTGGDGCYYSITTGNGDQKTLFCESPNVNCRYDSPNGTLLSSSELGALTNDVGSPTSCIGTGGSCDSNTSQSSCTSSTLGCSWDYNQSFCYSGGSTTSCWSYGSDQSACSSAGCTWYSSHTDGPTGGAHCDDSAHGTSGSVPSNYTTSSSCAGAGYYWCSSDNLCSSSSSGCGTGTSDEMQNCFYPNATQNGQSLGWTVWCEKDYYNCHLGDPSGDDVSLTGLSLGAPSSCEYGWSNTNTGGTTTSGPADYTTSSSCAGAGYYWCNSGNYCSSSSSGCGTSTTSGTCDSNTSYDSCISSTLGCSWDNTSSSCYSTYDGGCGGTADLSEANCSAVSGCSWDSSGSFCYSGGTTTTSPSDYTDSSSCTSSGYYWCTDDSQCYSSSVSCSTPSTTTTTACSPAYTCSSSANCSASGYYWCDSTNQCLSSSLDCGSTTSGNSGTTNGATSGGGSASYTDESSCSGAGYYWCSTYSSCYDSSSGCDSGSTSSSGGTSSTSCWSYGSDNAACTAASCIWYPDHTDGPTGGAHCDDSGHGASSGGSYGGGCGEWTDESGCLSQSGCAWSQNYCYAQ